MLPNNGMKVVLHSWAHAGGFVFGAILGPLLGLFGPIEVIPARLMLKAGHAMSSLGQGSVIIGSTILAVVRSATE